MASRKIKDLTEDEFATLAIDTFSKFPMVVLEKAIRETHAKIEAERKTDFDVTPRELYDAIKNLESCQQNKEEWVANHRFVSVVRKIWFYLWRTVVVTSAAGFSAWVVALKNGLIKG